MLVADAWQRRGLGAALVETLVARARDRGVDRLAATVLPTRPGLLRALARRLELEYVTPSADSLTGLYMLSDTTVADPVRSDAAVAEVMVSASGRGPRDRMVFSAAQLIRRDGVTATGLREVVEHAEAPRGSLQHYFPGGKEQLVNEAVDWAGRYAAGRIARFVAGMRRPTPGRLFAAMVEQWTDDLAGSDFRAGCPVAAATVDCADSVESTRTAVSGCLQRLARADRSRAARHGRAGPQDSGGGDADGERAGRRHPDRPR